MKRLLAASTMGILAGTTASFAQGSTLTVAYYGGNWGEAFDACVAKPFAEATGVKVVAEIGNSTTTLAKLQQQAADAVIDVAYLDGGISELAQESGVLQPIDLGTLANAGALKPQAIYKAGNDVFAVSAGYYSLGLTYNTQEVTETPTSWDALWNEDYAGAVTIPSPNNSAGVPFVLFLNGVYGDGTGNLDPTFAKLKELDAGLLYDTSGAASNAFQSNEVIIGPHFNVGAWDLIDAGMPIGFVVPKEGVWATDARMHIVKGTKNPDAAAKFIDTALSSQAATCLAEQLYLGPAVDGVELPAEVEKKLPWGEGGSIDNLKLFDWTEVNAQRQDITDRWNREIAN
ncbi:ABC transporter substrate-binding protein [Paracoccus luteus]|uniref:ABC transporter substrate-binding protein n=1 Tax=Paracoccus luteus TaxID=2508543 RepID=UPI00106F43CD|nr:ABC transporter substrate-binding protein [Paracoccus luteus]